MATVWGGDGRPPAEAPRAAEVPADLAREMSRWSGLPVEAGRRPVVLTGAVAHAGQDLLRSASLDFDDPGELPDGPSEAQGYRLVGAREALATLHRLADEHPRDRRAVALTGVRPGTATFWTDRGRQVLPAWLVTVRAAPGERPRTTVAVLAIRPGEWFRANAGGVVGIAADGRALLVSDKGSTCIPGYWVDAFETRTAVAYRVTAVGDMGPNPCDPEPRTAILRVPLRRPLGNRVVVAHRRFPAAYAVLPCGAQESVGGLVPPCTPT